ncbi:MAG: hypothetical protein ABIB11_00970, partial [Candidatus Omnitrophota bacterium]
MLAGPSGAGKTTFIDSLVNEDPDHFVVPPLTTTRQARPGEKDNDHRRFKSEEDFMKERDAGKLLMVRKSHGNWHGVEKQAIRNMSRGKVVLFDTTSVGSIRLIKEAFPDAKIILVLPDAPEKLKDMEDSDIEDMLGKRIAKRSTMDQKEFDTRLDYAVRFIREADEIDADDIIINDSLENLNVNKERFVKSVYRLVNPKTEQSTGEDEFNQSQKIRDFEEKAFKQLKEDNSRLAALNREAEKRYNMQILSAYSGKEKFDRESYLYVISAKAETDIFLGKICSEITKIAKTGWPHSGIIERTSTVVCELCEDMLKHGGGGIATLRKLYSGGELIGFEVVARDMGKGLDIEHANSLLAERLEYGDKAFPEDNKITHGGGMEAIAKSAFAGEGGEVICETNFEGQNLRFTYDPDKKKFVEREPTHEIVGTRFRLTLFKPGVDVRRGSDHHREAYTLIEMLAVTIAALSIGALGIPHYPAMLAFLQATNWLPYISALMLTTGVVGMSIANWDGFKDIKWDDVIKKMQGQSNEPLSLVEILWLVSQKDKIDVIGFVEAEKDAAVDFRAIGYEGLLRLEWHKHTFDDYKYLIVKDLEKNIHPYEYIFLIRWPKDDLECREEVMANDIVNILREKHKRKKTESPEDDDDEEYFYFPLLDASENGKIGDAIYYADERHSLPYGVDYALRDILAGFILGPERDGHNREEATEQIVGLLTSPRYGVFGEDAKTIAGFLLEKLRPTEGSEESQTMRDSTPASDEAPKIASTSELSPGTASKAQEASIDFLMFFKTDDLSQLTETSDNLTELMQAFGALETTNAGYLAKAYALIKLKTI